METESILNQNNADEGKSFSRFVWDETTKKSRIMKRIVNIGMDVSVAILALLTLIFHTVAYYITYELITGKVQVRTLTYPAEGDSGLWTEIQMHGWLYGYVYSTFNIFAAPLIFGVIGIVMMVVLRKIKAPSEVKFVTINAIKVMLIYMVMLAAPIAYHDMLNDMQMMAYFVRGY